MRAEELMSIDYSKLGLKVGLEIHQQLDTAGKLFCACKPELFKENPEITFLRRLRPTQSELGQIDQAAYFEFQKGVKILYEANRASSCLVEMDEEPPHNLNPEAVDIALTVALMVNAKPTDEIHVMRKTVIDGSNTTGFQRTCVIALNGRIEAETKKIPIQLIALEEDAARKIGDEDNGKTIRYRIDRLGIPLIEVTTGPVLYTPQEAEKTALAIGRILRATGKVKRGIGTIRQDLNIDIKDGALVEIKGVQELELVSKAVEYEAQRQLNLIKIRQELKQRDTNESALREEFIDASEIFVRTQCKVIKKALEDDKQVLAVKLPQFAGLLKTELMPGVRLGTEMADRARFWGRVGGIFHTDEMPAYGITTQEVDQLKKIMKAEEQDALVFVADKLENATDALKVVVERAKEAFKGVPEETRAANPDGTTRYMRPRPGAARMYPETDVPPIQITQDRLKQLRANLPEMPEQKMERLTESYGLNQKLAKQVLDSEYAPLFEIIAKETKVSPTVVAAVLTETMKSLKREGTPTENISDQQLRQLFELIDTGQTVKEAVPDIIAWLAKHENASANQAVENLGLSLISQHEIEETINTIIKENKALVDKSGEAAFGALMGQVMKKIRGKADAEMVVTALRKKLKKT
jgi:glutamyl-tRNA(Gln) amidotransferase subunit E